MAGNELRFSVSDCNGFRAATWKLWTPKTKSDFYLSCRELKGTIKASFHESGSWHFGYTKEAYDKHFDSTQGLPVSKYVEIWNPKPISDFLTFAFRIITPFSAVKTPIIGISNMKWIPNCSTGMATEILIFISTLQESPEVWMTSFGKKVNVVGCIILNDRETVWVIHQEIPMPEISIPQSEARFFKNASEKDLTSRYLKALVFKSNDKNGIRTIFDLSVE